MDFPPPLSAMALPTVSHAAVDFPINQSGEFPAIWNIDDYLNDPNEVYFSPEDDHWLIPAETEAPAKIPTTAGLHLGFKFRPSDEELILYYLQPEFIDSASARKGIITPSVDIYCYEPYQLQGMAVDYGDGKMYFYTYLKKLGRKKTDRRIRSRAGYQWKATQVFKPILDSRTGNITLGYKTPLAYYEGEKKTQWLMQEYRLNHASRDTSRELVLAVIYYHHRKRRREEDEGS